MPMQAQEIEDLIVNHPKVLDAAVFGVPNEDFGEEVKAVVQLVAPDEAASDELISYCRDHLAGYKCPRTVDVVEALPRHANGKLMKRLLRDHYWPEA